MSTKLKKEMWWLGIEIIDILELEDKVKLSFKRKLWIHRAIREYVLEVFKPLILREVSNVCIECGAELPSPILENNQLITICKCGATYKE